MNDRASTETFSGSPPNGVLGFVHVDMDAFYVSVELRRRPELQAAPVVVGGIGDRGVVAAASYVARSYGIHSAMPTSQARRLCPHAVFLPGDHAHYSEVSERVMAILRNVTPYVEPLSLDEAFLDVRGVLHHVGSAASLATEIRAEILAAEGLTCSIGVATNKFLAKLATERAKPRASARGPVFGSGVHVVNCGGELAFLEPMAVRELWGVGPATEAKLSSMGIETVGDLAAQPPQRLVSSLGRASGIQLHRLANAIDDRPVVVDARAKSIGHEETFPRDLTDSDLIGRELVRMVDAVASRLHRAGVVGKTVTVKVKFGDFSSISRSLTLAQPTNRANVVRSTAETLLAKVDLNPGIRLLGVSVSQLGEPVAQQLSFDDAGAPGLNEADDVVEAIRDRFGGDAIGPATLARSGRPLDRMVKGQQQWGPDDL